MHKHTAGWRSMPGSGGLDDLHEGSLAAEAVVELRGVCPAARWTLSQVVLATPGARTSAPRQRPRSCPTLALSRLGPMRRQVGSRAGTSTSRRAAGMSSGLTETVALITGATSGIGKPTASALADRGAHTLVGGRSAERGEQGRPAAAHQG